MTRCLFAAAAGARERPAGPPSPSWVRTGVAILSYNGKVSFGVTGDWDSVPDIDVLAEGIEAGMAELLGVATAPS